MKEVKCDSCGKNFERYPSKVKNNNFCSEECYGTYKKDNVKGKKNPRWKEYPEKQCANCEEKFKVKPANYKRRVTCSKQCENKYRQEIFYREKNPNWKGGYDPYYGKKWSEKQRQKIKEAEKCAKCGSEQNLVVHHIKPVREFENFLDAHSDENLAVVCRVCHPKVEKLSYEKQIQVLS